MTKKNEEVPGNVLATQANIQREASRLSYALHKLDFVVQEDDERDPWLVGLRIKPPGDDSAEWLVVATGDTLEGAVVAFHTAGTLTEALRGVAERYVNKTLKWRDDEYRRK